LDVCVLKYSILIPLRVHNSWKTLTAFFSSTAFVFGQDVQWNDLDYADKRRVFTFDPQRFVDLPDMVKEFHQKGMKYILILVRERPQPSQHIGTLITHISLK
jgi:hypothetical protein